MVSKNETGIKILFYDSVKDTTGLSIGKMLASVVLPERLESCESLSALENRFRRPNDRLSLTILNIESVEELTDLIRIKVLMDDLRIILIIPDEEKETVQQGHKLYPRFMADKAIDMNHLAAVVRKILSNIEHLQPNEN